MGVFDSFMNGAESLFDWTDSNGTDIFSFDNIVGAGAKAIGTLSEGQDAETKQRMNSWDATQRGTVPTGKGDFTPGKANYGLANYAPDPNAIEAFWNARLRNLVDVKDTKVSKASYALPDTTTVKVK